MRLRIGLALLLLALTAVASAAPSSPEGSVADTESPESVTPTPVTPERLVQAQQASAAQQQIREELTQTESVTVIEQQVTRGAVEILTTWFRTNIVYLGTALLVYVLLLYVVEKVAKRLRRHAQRLRDEISLRSAPPAEVSEEITEAVKPVDEAAQERLQREIENLEERTQLALWRSRFYSSFFFWLLTLAFLVHLGGYMFHAGGTQVVRALTSPVVMRNVAQRLVTIAIIILVVMFIGRMVKHFSARLVAGSARREDISFTEREQRLQTLSGVISGAVSVLLFIVAIVLILQQLELPVGPLIAGAGIAGIAIGFGAQSLVRDFISGFFILFENQYRVGDIIRVGETGGLVERITLRATYLRDIGGVVHIIPNGEITRVSNMTFSWSRHVADIGVSYRSDPDQVIEVLRRVGREMLRDETWGQLLLEEPEVPGLREFADSALVFRVLLKTKPLKQWVVGYEYQRRIKYAFDAAGIEIPYPHRTVYHRQEPEEKPFDARLEPWRPGEDSTGSRD
ncbi:mechanosensitive ion channel family protein [Candidatus Sumerlaeota bacterium]|nr:mechanosensitive ion channel family protein [Candidatus Sumerlaeota bacterium]